MIFSFDVESIGLYGEGYAVGGVLIGDDGTELDSFLFASDPDHSNGNEGDREWVRDNVPALEITHDSAKLLRDAFWLKYLSARDLKADIVVDGGYPVETNFLAACVRDSETVRKWQAPYPLLDLMALLKTKGHDPKAKYARLDSELPEHNPLCDARQSARLWRTFGG